MCYAPLSPRVTSRQFQWLVYKVLKQGTRPEQLAHAWQDKKGAGSVATNVDSSSRHEGRWAMNGVHCPWIWMVLTSTHPRTHIR